jgi:predicted NACHT family NTPase
VLHFIFELALLDGLDEVAQLVKAEILTEIRYFTQEYYSNYFVITSRLTSQSFDFPGFVTVELDDFNNTQIEDFVNRWFVSNHPNPEQGQIKANQFIEEMNKPGNQSLRELIVTPILLSLVCSIFLKRTTFPRKRDRVYQAGLDILLESWDQARGIQRDQIHHNLTIADKLKLLCLIAAETFERDQYFFEKEQILSIISEYLQSLNPENSDPEILRRESEAILKAIEIQHGLLVERAKDVFSFSHLTFQEYLAARKILYSPTPEIQAKRIEMLALRTDDVRWHEVLRLSANILPTGDRLLEGMSEQVQYFLPDEPVYQAILQELEEKQRQITSGCHPSAVRAFYLTLCSNRDLQLANLIDDRISQKLEPDLALDLTLARLHDLAVPFVEAPDLKNLVNLMFAFDLDRKYNLDPSLKAHLDHIRQQLPTVEDPEQLVQWQPQGEAWLKELQEGFQKTRKIGEMWKLTSEELDVLQTYYELNILLVECLQQSQIQPKLKETIESKLLKAKG